MTKSKRKDSGLAILAFGGNAIIRKGQSGEIHTQFANTRRVLQGVVSLVQNGSGLIIVHGNGPQVGNELFRSQLAASEVPELPLGVLVADTEGGMGYMIQQCLQNVLWKNKLKKPVVTILTQVVCDKNDPHLYEPTKPIGRFFSEADAKRLMNDKGWVMKEDAGRGWRLVVPSPRPVRIIEDDTISMLVEAGIIVIAGGGGGIPIVVEPNGDFEGQDVVVDKDFTASLIGHHVGADTLIIATDIQQVALNFNTPQQVNLSRMTVSEAQRYLNEGHFLEGSMGPKIEASIRFIESGGDRVIIAAPDRIAAAIRGEAGTTITSD
ncbi:MAG: carbamate kinase [Acidobacteriota bacterium]|nr:MAG: carbamate kinase [Acidobacteriota bacterium]